MGSAAWVLERLPRLRAVEHTWEDQAIVTQATEVDAELGAILEALGIQLRNPLAHLPAPTANSETGSFGC